MTAETITRVINESRRLLEGKEGLEEYLAEFESYIRSEEIDTELGGRLAFRLAVFFHPGDAQILEATNKLLALINLKQGEDSPGVRAEVYPSAWERL